MKCLMARISGAGHEILLDNTVSEMRRRWRETVSKMQSRTRQRHNNSADAGGWLGTTSATSRASKPLDPRQQSRQQPRRRPFNINRSLAPISAKMHHAPSFPAPMSAPSDSDATTTTHIWRAVRQRREMPSKARPNYLRSTTSSESSRKHEAQTQAQAPSPRHSA